MGCGQPEIAYTRRMANEKCKTHGIELEMKVAEFQTHKKGTRMTPKRFIWVCPKCEKENKDTSAKR